MQSLSPENGTPNCAVDLNPSGCTFNPTVLDASLLPPPSVPTGGFGPPSVPIPAWAAAVLVGAVVIVLGVRRQGAGAGRAARVRRS